MLTKCFTLENPAVRRADFRFVEERTRSTFKHQSPDFCLEFAETVEPTAGLVEDWQPSLQRVSLRFWEGLPSLRVAPVVAAADTLW
jgi:hypothetical protein